MGIAVIVFVTLVALWAAWAAWAGRDIPPYQDRVTPKAQDTWPFPGDNRP